MNIGQRIKKIRLTQRRVMQQIADECGLTRSYISKIENGVVVPSIAALLKISKALGVDVAILISEENVEGSCFTQSEQIILEKFIKTEEGYSFYSFADQYRTKKMNPYLFSARKEEIIAHKLSHEGEEFIYMLEGKMIFQVSNIEYVLKEGDSLYFNSIEEHGITQIIQDVKYINIFIE